MALKKTAYLLCALLISGCATGKGREQARLAPDEGKVRTFAEIYRKAKEAGLSAGTPVQLLRVGPMAGDEKPYFPVYEAPQIAKVWVPAHLQMGDKRVMVAGHWTFVVVQDSRWYIENKDMVRVEVPVLVPTPPRKE